MSLKYVLFRKVNLMKFNDSVIRQGFGQSFKFADNQIKTVLASSGLRRCKWAVPTYYQIFLYFKKKFFLLWESREMSINELIVKSKLTTLVSRNPELRIKNNFYTLIKFTVE